jgi:hypothetical protein
VYVECSVEECERRDVKGLYKMARQGEIRNYTGISSNYEAPLSPDCIISTEAASELDCSRRLMRFIEENAKLGRHTPGEHAEWVACGEVAVQRENTCGASVYPV